MVNIDQSTGIHYGVIPVKLVKERWEEKSEPEWEFDCPFCGEHFGSDFGDKCPTCKMLVHEEDFQNLDPTAFFYAEDGYFLDQEFKHTIIYVSSSPYYTMADPCIGFAPNAGDLSKEGKMFRTYCLGHEWFDGGAPYKVFRVKDGEEVLR